MFELTKELKAFSNRRCLFTVHQIVHLFLTHKNPAYWRSIVSDSAKTTKTGLKNSKEREVAHQRVALKIQCY